MALHAAPIPEEPPKLAAVGDEPPKRGRGRPRKDPTDTAPRRRSSTRSLETAIGAFLVEWNTPAVLLAPRYALEPNEIVALAKTTDEQCKRNPRFRKYVERVISIHGAINFYGVFVMIVARRTARAGLIPTFQMPTPFGQFEVTPPVVDDFAGALISQVALGGKTVIGGDNAATYEQFVKSVGATPPMTETPETQTPDAE